MGGRFKLGAWGTMARQRLLLAKGLAVGGGCMEALLAPRGCREDGGCQGEMWWRDRRGGLAFEKSAGEQGTSDFGLPRLRRARGLERDKAVLLGAEALLRPSSELENNPRPVPRARQTKRAPIQSRARCTIVQSLRGW